MGKLTKEERIAKRAKAKEIRAKIQAKTPANYEVPKLKARDAKKTAAAKKALLDNAAKNGGARRVCLQKKPAYYAAQHNARRTPLVRAAPPLPLAQLSSSLLVFTRPSVLSS